MKISGSVENKLVLDSSVLIKWIIDEDDEVIKARSIESGFLDGKYKILLPMFYIWELNNFISRHFDPVTATSIFWHFKSYKFINFDLDINTAKLAFDITKRFEKISFYDASYHALAISENATFVTCDKKYYEKTKKLGHIVLLKDFNK